MRDEFNVRLPLEVVRGPMIQKKGTCDSLYVEEMVLVKRRGEVYSLLLLILLLVVECESSNDGMTSATEISVVI